MNKALKTVLVYMGMFSIMGAVVVPCTVVAVKFSKPDNAVMTADDIMNTVVHIRAFRQDYDYDEELSRSITTYSWWEGSGCLVSPDGLIMTAGHVIGDADRWRVELRNGDWYMAHSAYMANNLDVGFLKIDVLEEVPYLVFDHDEQELGQEVWLYGHPLGSMNKWTVSKGIISNLSRDCEGFFGSHLMIQSDAASWPGNSGGPLVDAEGEIVGVLVGNIVGMECLSYVSPGDICEQWMALAKLWFELQEIDRKPPVEGYEPPSPIDGFCSHESWGKV